LTPRDGNYKYTIFKSENWNFKFQIQDLQNLDETCRSTIAVVFNPCPNPDPSPDNALTQTLTKEAAGTVFNPSNIRDLV
jgi:hypothetical protein